MKRNEKSQGHVNTINYKNKILKSLGLNARKRLYLIQMFKVFITHFNVECKIEIIKLSYDIT